jgi:DNA topoisomerase IB
MPAERALACAVRLLDRGAFRIGSEDYAEKNKTYGLATMRKEHVTLRDGVVIFDYIAKSGKHRLQAVVDEEVHRTLKALKRRRAGGPELLAYKDKGGWRDVRSEDINAYLKDIAGDEYSAKDFRTWHATVYCAVALSVSVEAVTSQTARKRAITRAVKEVAGYLGNTPAVCRKSYIDPRVIDRYEGGVTIGGVHQGIGERDPFEDPSLAVVEQAVLDLLNGNMRSPLVEKAA